MSKIGTVYKFEMTRQLKKPSFWIMMLLFPLAICAILGISILSGAGVDSVIESGNFEDKKIAVIDEAGILGESKSMFIEAETVDAGIEGVKNKEYDIFYYVPANLTETNTIKIYDRAEDAGLFSFNSIPFANTLKYEVYKRLDPNQISIIENTLAYENINFDENGEHVNILGRAIVPIAILAVFYILICVFGNRLTMALVEEKENRISEMLLTSLSAKELVIGKILSLITLGFIQIAVLLIPVIAALIIFRDNQTVAGILSIIEINPGIVIGNIALLLVSYFLFAGACTLVGSLVPTARDASNYVGVAMVFIIAPLITIQSFIGSDPNIATYIMSYFPLTAPIALMLRNAFGNLPTYELIIGIIDLAIASAFILSLTVKSFQKNAINFSVVKPKLGVRKSWKH